MDTLSTANEGPWIECGYQISSIYKRSNSSSGTARRPKYPCMVPYCLIYVRPNDLGHGLHRQAHKGNVTERPQGGSKLLESHYHNERSHIDFIDQRTEGYVTKHQRQTKSPAGSQKPIPVETYMEGLEVITAHANFKKRHNSMTANVLMYIVPVSHST